jgi:hypothetical protein
MSERTSDLHTELQEVRLRPAGFGATDFADVFRGLPRRSAQAVTHARSLEAGGFAPPSEGERAKAYYVA